ncbi:MAG: glycoside hydrolase family 3 protein [Legionellaceae bacterium]|nr:glycoside hydrolase family 3 protein [Legionellaceae bacterium]MBP9776048.1 glycoside hydrolase family 3 protein [Legionellaceae bacterium]
MRHFISTTLFLVSILLCHTSFAQEISLRDKIGQMLIIGFKGDTINQDTPIAQIITANNLGGVILYDRKLVGKNIINPDQVQSLNQQLQSINHEGHQQHQRPDLPLLIGVDYEGGKVNRLREAYGFPATLSAAAIGQLSLDAANIEAANMANTLKTAGFNLDFAPAIDLNINPNNPIIGKMERSFSDNPGDVAKYAELFSQNFLAQHIQCAYKHFPGHGSSNADSHLGFVDVSAEWQADELEPYQQLLSGPNPCGMVMTAHIINRKLDATGLPATLSHKMLTELLREKMHFSGVVITDDMQMLAIRDNFGLKQAITLAINAGADMLMFANQLTPNEPDQDPKDLIDLIEKEVHLGHISEAAIEMAYQRIVTLKQTLQ